MTCDPCIFDRLVACDGSDAIEDDELLAAVARCPGCPRLGDPLIRALLDRLAHAARSARRNRTLAARREHEIAEIRGLSLGLEERMRRLERAHHQSSVELEEKTALLWLHSEIAAAANAATSAAEMLAQALRPIAEATGMTAALALIGDTRVEHLAHPSARHHLEHLEHLSRPMTTTAGGDPVASREPTWLLDHPLPESADAIPIALAIDDVGEPLGLILLVGRGIPAAERPALTARATATQQILTAQLGRVLARQREAMANAQARAAAEGASRAKSAFVASMSHELRTPLNAIIGYGELLAEELAEELGDAARDDARDVAARINLASRHLLGLINNILDLSKIEAGKMERVVEPVDLAALVDEVLAVSRPLAEARGNTVCFAPSTPLDPFLSDSLKLRQILFNLVGNAIKFTRRGMITVGAALVAGDSPQDRRLRLDVTDTGIGIDAAVLPRIYDAFQQASAATTITYGGTGLGLTLCKHLAQLLDGDLEVTSEVGVGSCFTLVVPAPPCTP